MSSQLSTFKVIDNALAVYYQRLGCSNYRNANGNGIILQYIIDEELIDEDLPIEKELGLGCDPNDCAYSWMNNDTEFPIPHYAIIDDEQKEAFIFYMLQYCYKHSSPPSDQYIKEKLICAVGGSVNNQLPQLLNSNIMHGSLSDSGRIKEVKRLINDQSQPKYRAGTHLHIFTATSLTKEIMDVIEEEFESELILRYYCDISTALQINDHQMIDFTILRMDGEEREVSLINYDLHVKGTYETFYGVIVPNNNYKIQQDKWLWKLDEFLTAKDIVRKYKIKPSELPQSSRQMARFQKQLSQTLVIEESLIDDTDWFTVQQIKSVKGNVEVAKVTVTLSKEIWIAECKKSFQNIDLPLIPVVVIEDNNHWIEWIKIVYIESQNIFVGVSCKCDKNNNKWSVQSICLDRDDIYNKHRLVGLKPNKYPEQLKNFKTSITEIKFSDDSSMDIDKHINILKEQVKSQQDSIVRLKESLLRAKNANKYNEHNGNVQDREPIIPCSKTYIFFCGYSSEYFHHQYQDLIDLLMFYYVIINNKLLLKPCINKQNLNNINWSNLKLLRSQSTNIDTISLTVTTTEGIMAKYCSVALERLGGNNKLIPIVAIDEHHNCYRIEWVLIVNIVDRNCDIGISFKYNDKSNVFIATAIYLDKEEIEAKHKLIGLKSNYCQHVRPFNLRKFKFKSDECSIIGDEDMMESDKEVMIHSSLELPSDSDWED